MCGFRLFYAEDHFSRRAWPYLVSVCGNFALLAQIPPRRGLAFGKSCDRRSDRERGIKKFVFAFPSLLARPLRAAAHFRAARLFFPTGHTLSSVIAASILTAADRRFGYAVVPLAVLIAFSRLYLFVHFSTDVLASVILGLVIGHCLEIRQHTAE